jgi:hypothetical protein
MDVSYEFLTAWGTIALALIAIVALIWESRSTRLALGADVLLKLQEQFDGKQMLIFRRKAVESILSCRSKTTTGLTDDVDDVLDFFENVALLVRRKVLDTELVWHSFNYWIRGYYSVAADHIKTEREKYPTRWEDLCWLHEHLTEFANIRDNRPALAERKMTDTEIDKFLAGEKATCDEAAA